MRKLLLICIISFFGENLTAQSATGNFCPDSVSIHVLKYVEKFDSLKLFPYYGAFNGRGYIGPVDPIFFEFRDTATKKELVHIVNHKNPIVKAFAFWALVHKDGVDLMPIIKQYIQDTTHLKGYWQFNPYSDNDYLLCDFFIEKATLFNPEITIEDRQKLDRMFDDFEITYSGLSLNQYTELDSMLIFTPNSLASSKLAYLNIKPDENIYGNLKELYQEKGIKYALISLAKFQKVDDLVLISNESDTLTKLSAIDEFPNAAFIPFLLEYGKSILNRPKIHELSLSILNKTYYSALCKYENDSINSLMQKIIQSNLNHEHIQYIYYLLCKDINPQYTEFYITFYNRWNFMDIDVYIYLCRNGKIDCIEKLKTDLSNVNKFFTSDISATDDIYSNSCWGDSYCEISKLVQLLLELDSLSGKQLIVANLKNCEVSLFGVLSTIASKINDSAMAKIILARMEKSTNYYEMEYATKALLNYKNDSYKEDVIRILNLKKPTLIEWQVRLLIETLKEHNKQWN